MPADKQAHFPALYFAEHSPSRSGEAFVYRMSPSYHCHRHLSPLSLLSNPQNEEEWAISAGVVHPSTSPRPRDRGASPLPVGENPSPIPPGYVSAA